MLEKGCEFASAFLYTKKPPKRNTKNCRLKISSRYRSQCYNRHRPVAYANYRYRPLRWAYQFTLGLAPESRLCLIHRTSRRMGVSQAFCLGDYGTFSVLLYTVKNLQHSTVLLFQGTETMIADRKKNVKHNFINTLFDFISIICYIFCIIFCF